VDTVGEREESEAEPQREIPLATLVNELRKQQMGSQRKMTFEREAASDLCDAQAVVIGVRGIRVRDENNGHGAKPLAPDRSRLSNSNTTFTSLSPLIIIESG
jgi:hypothetical protein